jgi:predicted TIM-barrel fold metal-dependent hydrolase
VKLGGLGLKLTGFTFFERDMPPSSEELEAAWRPYIETCIEAFSPHRSIFESNFPVDKGSCSYPVLWNAFKRILTGYSAEEKTSLFSGAATAFTGSRICTIKAANWPCRRSVGASRC